MGNRAAATGRSAVVRSSPRSKGFLAWRETLLVECRFLAVRCLNQLRPVFGSIKRGPGSDSFQDWRAFGERLSERHPRALGFNSEPVTLSRSNYEVIFEKVVPLVSSVI